jgi:signal transduction histidine kinase
VSSELEGVAARFDELRARLDEVGCGDDVFVTILAALQTAVAQQTEEVDAILDRLPVAVTVVDRSFHVARFNRRAREILGRNLTAGMPMSDWIVELFHLDGTPLEFTERPSVRALGGQTSLNVVFEARDTERGSYLISASSTPIRDATGEVIVAVTVFEDVTDGRRRAQADRDFVANAAHQIRTPIGAISSAFGALSAGAKDQPVARDRFLEHIEREIARMQQLADGLLALARAERGDNPAPLSVIRLRPLLQRVIDISTAKAGVDFALSCPEHMTAFTNDALLSEALANVVTNAVQHTTRGTVALRVEQTQAGASIDVCDEGPGIAEGDRERVFERFYRGQGSANTGVGLGLAIAAAATQASGGMLELVDSPSGACFRFTFQQTVLGG